MCGVSIRVEEANGDRLYARLLQPARYSPDGVGIDGLDNLAIGSDPCSDAKPQMSLDERWRSLDVKVEQIVAVLHTCLEHVDETGIRYESGSRSCPLDECIRN
jgi:hypothetical protein